MKENEEFLTEGEATPGPGMLRRYRESGLTLALSFGEFIDALHADILMAFELEGIEQFQKAS